MAAANISEGKAQSLSLYEEMDSMLNGEGERNDASTVFGTKTRSTLKLF
jgi:hypothetical protein